MRVCVIGYVDDCHSVSFDKNLSRDFDFNSAPLLSLQSSRDVRGLPRFVLTSLISQIASRTAQRMNGRQSTLKIGWFSICVATISSNFAQYSVHHASESPTGVASPPNRLRLQASRKIRY